MTDYKQADVDRVRAQLSHLTNNPVFAQATRLLDFLHYSVEEVIAGRGSRLSQYALGIEVYGRDQQFDPTTDSVVRVDAGRLRSKLREYYDTAGKDDNIRFELPKGTYAIHIHFNENDEQISPRGDANPLTVFPNRFSMVVMPFESLSNRDNDDQLADAITTEIIDELGRVKALEVVSRHSAFKYKNQRVDAREVGKELDVNFVLEGSLRRSGNHLRIGVALTDAANGRQMWTETYNREQAESLTLQDDIAHTIAAVLGGVLWRAAMEKAQRLAPGQLDAASRIHRAASMMFNFSPQTFAEGERLARREIEQDPELGHGYCFLAFLLSWKIICCWTENPAEAREEGLAAAKHAVQLAPNDNWVLGLTAESFFWFGESSRTLTLAERAVTLDPDNLVNRARLGNALVLTGKTEKGLEYIENAIVNGPDEQFAPPWHYYFKCFAYNQLGQYQQAEEIAHLTIDLMANCPAPWLVYVNALAENNKLDAAQNALSELLALSPQMTFERLEKVYQAAFESKQLAERHLSGLRKLQWA